MKAIRIAITLLFVLVTSVAFAASAAQKSFEELKALDGTWEGKTSERPAGRGGLSCDFERVRADERNQG